MIPISNLNILSVFDRHCRVYSLATGQCVHTIHKMSLGSDNHDSKQRSIKIYHDDTMKSFFRRLSFSPDGELLITPAGIVELPDKDKPDAESKQDDVIKEITAKETKETKTDVNATFIFTRRQLNK